VFPVVYSRPELPQPINDEESNEAMCKCGSVSLPVLYSRRVKQVDVFQLKPYNALFDTDMSSNEHGQLQKRCRYVHFADRNRVSTGDNVLPQ
jgi:hypothetical protein